MNTDTIIIKKYANRRLYDTSASRYINLEDIGAMVRNGKDLQVVDAKTGEDLTRVTLTQIIVEDAKDQPTGLPLELLRQLIVTSDRVGQEFVMWYLKSAVEAYQKVQNSLQSRFTQMQSAALSPLQMVKSLLNSDQALEPAQSSPELLELRQRIAELEAAQQKAQSHPPTAGTTGAKKRRSRRPRA